MPRFIPTEEIRRLTRGSYEHLISQLDEALQENAKKVFGSEVDTHLLGTFNGFALVVSEDGDCRRVKYEQGASGRVRIVEVEEVSVTSYAEEDLDGFLEKEAAAVVALFRKGAVTEATRRLQGLVAVSGKYTAPTRNSDLVETWLATLDRQRPWRRLYEGKKDQIHRSVWNGLKKIEDDRLRPKFRKLYDGSIEEADLSDYRDLVIENVQTLQARTQSLIERLQGSYAKMRVAASQLDDLSEGESMKTFTAFSEDLLADLARINTIATESPKQVNQSDRLGRLHDTMADRLFPMEVASLYVTHLATRLSEAQL